MVPDGRSRCGCGPEPDPGQEEGEAGFPSRQICEEDWGQGLSFRFLSSLSCPAHFGRETSIGGKSRRPLLQLILSN